MVAEASSVRLFQSVSVIAFRKNYSFVDSVPQHRRVLGVTVRLRQRVSVMILMDSSHT